MHIGGLVQRSTDRILVTHTGSLPRRRELLDVITGARRAGADERAALVRDEVADVVRRQVEAGVDVVNDGEAGKESYSTYVRERLSGFDGQGEAVLEFTDMAEFPTYTRMWTDRHGDVGGMLGQPACTGPIAVADPDAVHTDIANLRAATAGARATELFLSAASPGVIAAFFANHHYPSRDEYLSAIADAMRHEYEAITDAGFVLQLDCPDLAMSRHLQFGRLSTEEFRERARIDVEVLNQATANIDPDRMRIHLCWGNYEGPHHHDVDLADIIDVVLAARPNGIVLEAANPRHAHEWQVFENLRLPDGKVIMPGVVDSTSNYIEHPVLIAQRLTRYAEAVGAENVLAATDCGFATGAAVADVDPDIAWAKFRAMADGARIASRALYTRTG
ncbi:MAG TPA: cobalamin-independent methionine synthase II family protein [Pseudonocardia sp.]